MAGTLPPFFEISDEDHGGYVAVTVYTLLSLTICVVLTRLFSRWYIGRVLHADDILLAAATLSGLLQSIIVHLAISSGLGRKHPTVDNIHFKEFLKYEYVAQILLVVTIALAKVSSALLFKSTLTSRTFTWGNWALIGVITAWSIASILAMAFRCALPTPWEWVPDQCINQSALFKASASFNIITDVALVVFPCILLRDVQLSRWKRFRIMILIASKLIVCAATGVEIHYVLNLLASPDLMWASTNSTVWDQVMMNLSIITTALPSLGRLVVELQPDIYAFTIHDDPADAHKSDKYNISTMRKSYGARGDPPLSPGTSVQVTSGWRESFQDDAESMEGLVNPPNVIQQTIHFEVH
ncbi:hypothetical protein N7466_002665 [Penicillium verhagenii]|uniref:uncharacterized protein n=1 Tax=Penicillium verhagenii TaxID=1562060 RepID=UPI002544ECFA|nr:uncharacterized protein N7466_002665 [Penicillium verhagenii]KAJ5939531.1 hypothetical protein N7466_002665 [Penicillium verhagenii]